MGSVDLFHGRRANFHRCVYWVRDERDAMGTAEEWVTVNLPSGSFYAKPVTPKNNSANVINGVWMLDSNHIALETDDDVLGISRGSIVRFDGELWLVESVQKSIHNKESEFSKKIDYKYTIAMTRG